LVVTSATARRGNGQSNVDTTKCIIIKRKENTMAKGEQKSNRETKKPKKDKVKTTAAAPSQKTAGWQPTIGTGKKK
jgi:hypothetical protein